MERSTRSRVARPRIRRRLRVIALGLFLLPALAFALLLRAAVEADQRARSRERSERRERVRGGAEDLAHQLAARPDLFAPGPAETFSLLDAVPPALLAGPIRVDGDASDWLGVARSESGEPVGVAFDRADLLSEAEDSYDPRDFSFTVSTGRREDYLYLFLRVLDDDVRVRRRLPEDCDQIRLVASLPSPSGALLPARFVTLLEPGPDGGGLSTYQMGRNWVDEVPASERLAWGDYRASPRRRPYGFWRATAHGYDVELRLPLRTLGPRWREAELGLALVDVDRRRGAPGDLRRRSIWVARRREGALAPEAPRAADFRRGWSELGVNLRGREIAVFDARRRELFSSLDAADPGAAALRADTPALLDSLGDGAAPATLHAERPLAAARIQAAGGPLLGYVLAEDTEPEARPRLGALARESPLALALLVGALPPFLLLLVYTRSLSRRILALVDDVGAGRDADDEIGELSRRLSDLSERDRRHREYLEQLPRILAHETLGPLGVVEMSLDDADAPTAAGREARHQAARLAIRSVADLIADLREATTLEEALARGERVEVDLREFLEEYLSAWRDARLAPLEARLFDGPCRIVVIERRIEQLLDKLLDNACDFSDGSPIRVSLEGGDGEARIRVENGGSQLPADLAPEQLFDAMTSGRKLTSERHLGLGLYVARVIAEHHGGSIRAWNADEAHVAFEVTLRGASGETAARR